MFSDINYLRNFAARCRQIHSKVYLLFFSIINQRLLLLEVTW